MTSKDEQSEQFQKTTKLTLESRSTLVVPGHGKFGLRFSSKEVTYHPVPSNYQSLGRSTPWRIQLKFGAPIPHTIVGLDLYGDIVLGRGKGDHLAPDIDLSEQDGATKGVSRRHALLRPGDSKLFILDLESTNGTSVNTVPVGKGMAVALKGGDTVALGELQFTVELVSTPLEQKTQSTDGTPTQPPETSS